MNHRLSLGTFPDLEHGWVVEDRLGLGALHFHLFRGSFLPPPPSFFLPSSSRTPSDIIWCPPLLMPSCTRAVPLVYRPENRYNLTIMRTVGKDQSNQKADASEPTTSERHEVTRE